MKTTIEIPEPLYKQAKIRAIETGQTLKSIVLHSLTRELSTPSLPADEAKSFLERRRLLPGYQAAGKHGAFRPKPEMRDATELISEDRDAR